MQILGGNAARAPVTSGPTKKIFRWVFTGVSDWNEEWLHQTRLHLPSFNESITLDEEQKIRNELEIEIERDLEKEIKDGICRLALRLHGFYRYRKRKYEQSYSSNESTCSTEVNIIIGVDGHCKVEIYERMASVTATVRPRSSWSEAKQGKSSGNQGFHWPKTLRDGSGLSSGSPKKKRHGVLHHGEGHCKNKNHEVRWRY